MKGWTVAGVYVDNDRSASNGKARPEWERLLADVRAGKIDAVAAFDQDRVNRTMEDFIAYKSLFIEHKVLLATSNNGDIDLSTPQGVMMAGVKTLVSEHEIAMMRIRQLRAARARAEGGKPKWRRAFGYLPYEGRKEDDDGTRRPDPRTAPLVKSAYRAVLSGVSLGDIATSLNEAGAYGLTGRPWAASTVSLFLRSPRNAGLRSHRGQIVGNGTWTPLVTPRVWKQVQDKLEAPGRKPGPKSVRRHLLTAMLQCGKPGCDGHLSGYSSTEGRISYRCKTCLGVAVQAVHVEPMLYGLLGGRLAMPDAEDLLKAEHDEETAEKLRTELTVLYQELTNIGVERGKRLLTGEQAKTATDIVQAEIAELERQQNDAERLRVLDGIPLGTPEAIEAVRLLSPDRFRTVLRLLMTVTVLPVGRGSHTRTFDPARVQVDWK